MSASTTDLRAKLAELREDVFTNAACREEYQEWSDASRLFDEVEREVAALAREAASVDAWQPIETAPKDGETSFLAWTANIDHPCMEMAFRPADCPDDAAFDLMGMAIYPTHWQPLPEPPRATDTARPPQGDSDGEGNAS